MIYFPWRTYDEQDAAYYCVFVCGYPFDDARRVVKQAAADLLEGMAELGRRHRSACQRGLAAMIDQMDRTEAQRKRLMPVVVTPNAGVTGA